MSVETTNDMLNRLLVIHSHSLPDFLADAYPSWKDKHVKAAEVLADIVDDQRAVAARVGRLLVENDGVVASGQFPDRFSSFHDLAYDFMLAQLIRYQDRMIAAIEQMVQRLPRASMAQGLAQEALGMAKAHRDALGDLQSEAAGKLTGGP